MQLAARNNHYIPRFYLKNWSAGKNNKVWRYRLLVSNENLPLWEYQSIRAAGCQTNLYIKNDSDELEKWFGEVIEQPASEVFAKLMSRAILNKKDYDVLSRFVAAQFVRTTARFNRQVEFYSTTIPPIIKKVVDDVIQTPFERRTDKDLQEDYNLFDSEQNPADYLELGTKTNGDDLGVEVKTDLRKLWLWEIKYLVQNRSEILMNHNWQIVEPAFGEWCTSDNPVICFNCDEQGNYNFNGGWANRGSRIICPLTPKHLLYTEIGTGYSRNNWNRDPPFSCASQKLIIEHAFRNIYAVNRFDSIYKCRKRMVNDEKYSLEEQHWKTKKRTPIQSSLCLNVNRKLRSVRSPRFC